MDKKNRYFLAHCIFQITKTLKWSRYSKICMEIEQFIYSRILYIKYVHLVALDNITPIHINIVISVGNCLNYIIETIQRLLFSGPIIQFRRLLGISSKSCTERPQSNRPRLIIPL